MKLSKEIKMLLVNTVAHRFIAIYASIFVNLYVWMKDGALFDIALLNAITLGLWGLSYLWGTRLLYLWNNRGVMLLGACCSAVAFLLLPFGEGLPQITHILLVGGALGLFQGFYYSAKNITLVQFGEEETFHAFFSAAAVIAQSVNLLAPILSGLFIYVWGFHSSFFFMVLCSSILAITILFIPYFSMSQKPYQPMKIGEAFRSPSLTWLGVSYVAGGFFRQFQSLFLIVFTFTVTQHEVWVALLNTLYVILTILSIKVYKKMKRVSDIAWLYFGITVITLGYSFVFLGSTFFLILANILTTIGMYYFNTIYVSQQFQILHRATFEERVHLFSWREVVTVTSRVLLLLIAMTMGAMEGVGFAVIMALAILCGFLVPYLQKKALETKGS
ncbi:hypothetical protein IMZ31_18870 (plasmid) [Pontibacillus sp. ALD_SL1]|uniref:MFS transporter n=1 Tax=Pontibacillus sp. ALD_SL1 TaxID=2777185 RepID=UPI001A97A069|nr:MFS transporter [Pontibacillus sp. ALD_SL1]QST02612.1 hypothetical protein IMZ31_18870 [Pontibacillus sp. ALD_SL1]